MKLYSPLAPLVFLLLSACESNSTNQMQKQEQRTAPASFNCYLELEESTYELKAIIHDSGEALTYQDCTGTVDSCTDPRTLELDQEFPTRCGTSTGNSKDFVLCLDDEADLKETPRGKLLQASYVKGMNVELWCDPSIRASYFPE